MRDADNEIVLASGPAAGAESGGEVGQVAGEGVGVRRKREIGSSGSRQWVMSKRSGLGDILGSIGQASCEADDESE